MGMKSVKILAPGRYVGKAMCHHNNGVYQCNQDEHFDDKKNHLNVVITYHVPHIGVIRIWAATEKEADLMARTRIYEATAKEYLSVLKHSMELEKLMKDTL